jgi:hypothetical protein
MLPLLSRIALSLTWATITGTLPGRAAAAAGTELITAPAASVVADSAATAATVRLRVRI